MAAHEAEIRRLMSLIKRLVASNRKWFKAYHGLRRSLERPAE